MSSLIRGLHSSVYARKRVENCIVLTVYADSGKKDLQFNDSCMGVRGSYTVDWGDGTVNSENSHTYSSNGTYTVRIRGNIYEIEGYNEHSESVYDYWIPLLQTSVMVKKVSFNSPCSMRIGRHAVIGSPSGRIEEVVFGENVVSVGYEGEGSHRLYDGLFAVQPEKITFLSRKCKLNNCAFATDSYGAYASSINIPDGCSEIPKDCFFSLGLSSVLIPEGIVEIKDSAFKRCSRLTDVALPSTVNSVGKSAFEGCTLLKTADFSRSKITLLDEYVLSGSSANSSNIEEILLPATTQRIHYKALNGCNPEKLTKMTIYATTPPGFVSAVMPSTLENVDLKVPASSVQAYLQSPYWDVPTCVKSISAI